jgi:hypothetical protein
MRSLPALLAQLLLTLVQGSLVHLCFGLHLRALLVDKWLRESLGQGKLGLAVWARDVKCVDHDAAPQLRTIWPSLSVALAGLMCDKSHGT